MKTNNTLKTGIVIGIFVIMLPLILMGSSYSNDTHNKFEITVQQNGSGVNSMKGYLLNTETGETWLLVGDKKTKITDRP